jgi:hypothetical protein
LLTNDNYPPILLKNSNFRADHNSKGRGHASRKKRYGFGRKGHLSACGRCNRLATATVREDRSWPASRHFSRGSFSEFFNSIHRKRSTSNLAGGNSDWSSFIFMLRLGLRDDGAAHGLHPRLISATASRGAACQLSCCGGVHHSSSCVQLSARAHVPDSAIPCGR